VGVAGRDSETRDQRNSRVESLNSRIDRDLDDTLDDTAAYLHIYVQAYVRNDAIVRGARVGRVTEYDGRDTGRRLCFASEIKVNKEQGAASAYPCYCQ
jgi:hypothetical protein